MIFIIVSVALSSMFGRGKHLFALTPSKINTKDSTIAQVNATLSSPLHKLRNNSSWIQFGSDVDNLSVVRPGGNIFPGAREWHNYWSYTSRKSKSQHNEDNTNVHDDYVLSFVESVSESTLQHIFDMKSRYESVGALPDFYARGLGWILDVSR